MRKSLVLSIAALVLAVSGCAHSARAENAQLQTTEEAHAEKSTYFRAWGGFKRTGLSAEQFTGEFPAFMQQTVDLYGNKLNNYIVVIPPETKPSYVPDEFALVAIDSEESYRAIRATPEGQAYGEAHWNFFDKTTSKSATNKSALDEVLVSGTAYDLSGRAVDWTKGYTMFFLGTRKAGVSTTEFLARLKEHVQLVTGSLKPLGMKGYVVIANDNFEAAYINWESKEAMDSAFAGSAGKNVGADARTFMDVLMWEGVKTLGPKLTPGVYDSHGKF